MKIERFAEPQFTTGAPPDEFLVKRDTARNVKLANQQLWVFDPNETMSMVRFGDSFHIEEGLRLHFCTLGRDNGLWPWDQGDKVRWASHMDGGDYSDEP